MSKSREVRNDIPLPSSRAKPRYWQSLFEEMKPGQSFSVAVAEVYRVRVAIQYARRFLGSKASFAVRQHGNAYRCWRMD
jgi:hypothetical protein